MTVIPFTSQHFLLKRVAVHEVTRNALRDTTTCFLSVGGRLEARARALTRVKGVSLQVQRTDNSPS